MARAPGEAPAYCTGGVVVLGHIISTTFRHDARQRSRRPIYWDRGCQDSGLAALSDGRATGGGAMRLRPRDAAKFGSLYLNAGRGTVCPVHSRGMGG